MFDRREGYFPRGQSSGPLCLLLLLLLLPCRSIISPFLHLILRQQGGLHQATTGNKQKAIWPERGMREGGGMIRWNAGLKCFRLHFLFSSVFSSKHTNNIIYCCLIYFLPIATISRICHVQKCVIRANECIWFAKNVPKSQILLVFKSQGLRFTVACEVLIDCDTLIT